MSDKSNTIDRIMTLRLERDHARAERDDAVRLVRWLADEYEPMEIIRLRHACKRFLAALDAAEDGT